ncbi:BON domain protein [Novipirellula galeiformis]|uniref:BON domain protein n=1 Tax=Novipirellula galeiformis TaxID=2528004 RepID=A0A5C6C2F8_9BACT|nr:BON domain-containing protein [Novipirellula galeiformis]TWU17696.1 BON domain protein [Novipirellula galeiformis]
MHIRLSIVVAILSLLAHPAFAQQPSIGAATGNAGSNGSANTGGATASNGGGGSNTASANAAEAFSGIQRGDTVGATGATGSGFNDLSGAGAGVQSGGGLGRFGGLGGFGAGGLGAGGLGALFGNANASSSTKSVIRTQLRSAIDVAPRSSAEIQQSAVTRMLTLPSQSQIPGVNVTVDNQTVILGGVVGSEKQRRMSELLMRLEPGVRNVENRIRVSSSAQ